MSKSAQSFVLDYPWWIRTFVYIHTQLIFIIVLFWFVLKGIVQSIHIFFYFKKQAFKKHNKKQRQAEIQESVEKNYDKPKNLWKKVSSKHSNS